MAQNTFHMKKKNQKITDSEQLKFENELKKMELIAKTGAQFSEGNDGRIPPEVERQFLLNVERFEEAFQVAKTISIYEKIGKPKLIRPENLNERALSEELKKINTLLYEHSITIDSICGIDDLTMYTFIVDEFMQKETQDLKIPGFMSCFTYEKFHPNHEYDIKNRVNDAVNDLLKKGESDFERFHIKYIENLTELELFTKAFEKFTLHHFNITNVLIEDDKAIATFEIKFTGKMEGPSGKVIFDGTGSAKLDLEYDWWTVKFLELPV